MKINYFIILFIWSCLGMSAQNGGFQDPADWIPLEKNFGNVSTSIIPRPGQLPEMYSAPIQYISDDKNDYFPLKLRIRLLKFGYSDDGKEMVQFWGVVDLSCCKNKPVKVVVLDQNDRAIQFTTTEEDGSFKLISPNGNLLEFDNYRVKVNVHTIKIIDEELNEKHLVFNWVNKPSEKELKKMRKKDLRAYKKEQKYLEELRNKNNY